MLKYVKLLQPGEIDSILAAKGLCCDVFPARYHASGARRIVQRFEAICCLAIERRIALLPEEARPKVRFGFIDHKTPAAFSDGPNRPVVVIHNGVIPLIYAFFVRMLKMNNTMVNSSELEILPSADNLDTDTLWSEVKPIEHLIYQRKIQLWDRIRVALIYIVYHELAHVLRRHSDHLVGIDFTSQLTQDEARISHLMEFDADRMAIEWLVAACHDHVDSGRFRRDKAGLMRLRLYDNMVLSAKMVFFSIFVAYRPFYKLADDHLKFDRKAHPPAAARFIMAISSMYAILFRLLTKRAVDEFSQGLVWDEFEVIYCRLMGFKPDLTHRDFALSRPIKAYVLELLDQYKKLLGKLPDVGTGYPA